MSEAALLPVPLPPLSADQQDHLRLELGRLSDAVRHELWWWITQRGWPWYPAVPPDPARMPDATTHAITRYVGACSPLHQHGNWALCWYMLALESELDERERDLLSWREVINLALHGLRPLPTWVSATHLGRVFGRAA